MRKPSLRVATSFALALLAGCSSVEPGLDSQPDEATLVVLDTLLERIDRHGKVRKVPNDRAVLLDRSGERHYVDARDGRLLSDALPPGPYLLLVLRGLIGIGEEDEEYWVYVLPRDPENAVRFDLEAGRPDYLGLAVRRGHGPKDLELARSRDLRREREVWLEVLEDHPATPWEGRVRERIEALEARLPEE